MALVSLPNVIYYPGLSGAISGGPSLTTITSLTSAGHYMAYIFSAREDMTVSHVSFRAGTSAGSPTVIASIEGVDAGGLPDGAATYGGSASAATAVSSSTNPVIALGGSATITKGQLFCVKIAFSTGTSQVIECVGSYTQAGNLNIPYQVVNTGTPTRGLMNGTTSTFAVGNSSTTFYNMPGALPLSAFGSGAFNNTNSAKRGMRFVPPMNCRAIGVRWLNNGASGNYNAVLYNDAGTELSSSSTAVDGDHSGTSTNGAYTVFFDNTVTLTAGTAYRVAIEPTSATNVNVSLMTPATAGLFSATPAKSTAVYASFATATWTDSTTQLPAMDVILDQVDDGAGSGGGVVGVIGG